MPILSLLQNSPDSRLGLAFPGSDSSVYSAISSNGMGTCRLSAAWTSTIAGIRNRCDVLRSLGVRPFLTFECNDESKTRPDTHGITNQIPLSMDDWLAFVNEVVSQGPADYQFLNEWDSPRSPAGSWKGTDQEMIDFVTLSSQAVKAADPSAKVWMGGIAGADILAVNREITDWEICRIENDQPVCYPPEHYRTAEYDDLVNRKLAVLNAVAPYVDGLDIHMYGPVDRNRVRVEAIRSLGWTKPLCTAEAGGPRLAYDVYSGEKHFMDVVEGTLSALSEGLEFSGWYRLGEGPGTSYGASKTALYDVNRNPKPGLWAMKLLGAVLDGVTGVSRQGNVYTFSKAWGDRVLAFNAGWVFFPSGELWRVLDPVSGLYHVQTLDTPRWMPTQQWPMVGGM